VPAAVEPARWKAAPRLPAAGLKVLNFEDVEVNPLPENNMEEQKSDRTIESPSTVRSGFVSERPHSLYQRNSAQALYFPTSKKYLICVSKFVEAKDITLPDNVDEMVENGQGNKELKNSWSIPIKVGGMLWMKADRDAVREVFPHIAPKPRPANFRER
jgi:hypothetical protein